MRVRRKSEGKRRQEKERALYVRLPHTIRKEEDVAKLFTGDFRVNLPRQSSRHCYVIFSDVEEKLRNLKAAQNSVINGKHVIVAPAIIKDKKDRISKKKIVIPEIKDDPKVTRILFVSNINLETKPEEIKAAIPGCLTVKILKPYSKKSKAAIVKMESARTAAEYLQKIRSRPIVGGRRLRLNPDTRHRKKQSKGLKIYDGETEIPMQKSTSRENNKPLDHIVLENKTSS
ncbi:uncharacterized protein LOC100878502 [Megachile rotundata]|uniref:uncharacterized protein LOC100878502 n=1 Tax=Megachile rotundata TaxID=143995 RepID=UPI003FD66F41